MNTSTECRTCSDVSSFIRQTGNLDRILRFILLKECNTRPKSASYNPLNTSWIFARNRLSLDFADGHPASANTLKFFKSLASPSFQPSLPKVSDLKNRDALFGNSMKNLPLKHATSSHSIQISCIFLFGGTLVHSILTSQNAR